MLKKLVKYGNSTALVLDKAILELLNMEEGSIVKITTDGTSLVLTPQQKTEAKVSPTITPHETAQEATITHAITTQYPHLSNEQIADYTQRIKNIFTKYAARPSKLESQQYLEEIHKLKQEEKFEEIIALRKKYAPELDEMENELEQLHKEFGGKSYDKSKHNILLTNKGYVKAINNIQNKYRSVIDQLSALPHNPDYIQDSLLLSERYHATKDSVDYMKALTALNAKYIPDYAAYEQELKEASQAFSNK